MENTAKKEEAQGLSPRRPREGDGGLGRICPPNLVMPRSFLSHQTLGGPGFS